MSDTVLLALIASIAPTIAAVAAIFIGVRNSRKSDVIIEKAAEIHQLANSQLSTITSALEVANEKIQGLEKLIAVGVENKKEAKAAADATKS